MVGIRFFRFGMCLFSGVMLVLRSVCFLVNMFMALAMERAPMYLFHYGSPSNVTWLNHTHAVSTTQTSANWKFLISSSTEPIEKHLWIFSRQLLLMDQLIWPLPFMYGIFTYMYHKNQPNVGKYTIPMDAMGDVNCLINCSISCPYISQIIKGEEQVQRMCQRCWCITKSARSRSLLNGVK